MADQPSHISRENAVYMLGKATGLASRAEALLQGPVPSQWSLKEGHAVAALSVAYASIAATMFRNASRA